MMSSTARTRISLYIISDRPMRAAKIWPASASNKCHSAWERRTHLEISWLDHRLEGQHPPNGLDGLYKWKRNLVLQKVCFQPNQPHEWHGMNQCGKRLKNTCSQEGLSPVTHRLSPHDASTAVRLKQLKGKEGLNVLVVHWNSTGRDTQWEVKLSTWVGWEEGRIHLCTLFSFRKVTFGLL